MLLPTQSQSLRVRLRTFSVVTWATCAQDSEEGGGRLAGSDLEHLLLSPGLS